MYKVDQYTVSLLHFEDGLKDECGKAWTHANTKSNISNAQKKLGNSSLFLSGKTDGSEPRNIVTTESSLLSFGHNDFTIDWWEYRLSSSKWAYGFGLAILNSQYSACLSGGNDDFQDGSIYAWATSNNISYDILNRVNCGKLILNDWVHRAVSRKEGIFYFFENGKLINTVQSNLAIANGTSFNVGCNFNGYIDEFRISNIARWIENFTPPTDSETETGELLLVVTLAEEVEKEYEISKTEFDAFVSWYDNKAKGAGAPYYTFDKSFKRKDYLVFDKILTFTVTDFTK